jgi:hypothetical protein
MVMDALTKMPGKGLARRSAKGDGLALINEMLDADVAKVLQTARQCQRDMQRNDCYLGGERGVWEAKFLDRAKLIHNALLARAGDVEDAYQALTILQMPPYQPIAYASAVKMLSVLFGALSKKKANDENTATLLSACADMFSPSSQMIGESLGLWKPVSDHPVVLALTIKKLIATHVFSPSPSELRDAMKLVCDKIGTLAAYAEQWLVLLDKADRVVFLFDREAWNAAYANMNSRVPSAMVKLAEHDDCGHAGEMPPRYKALDKLLDAKLGAEQETETKRIAACQATPAKRTRKLTRTE